MKKNVSSQMVVHLYYTENLSTHEIAKKLEISQSTVRYHLRKLNQPLRNRSSAQKTFLENHQHQRFGKKHTEETKQKISEANRRVRSMKNDGRSEGTTA